MNVQMPLASRATPAPDALPAGAVTDASGAFEGLLADATGDGDALPAVSLIGSVLVDAEPALGDDLPEPEVGEPLLALSDESLAVPLAAAVPVDVPAAAGGVVDAARAQAGSALAQPAALSQGAAQPTEAQAALVDAGRAAPAQAGLDALPQPATSHRTLDSTPWFAVRPSGAEARGQALAQAVQPALQDATPLATRAAQGIHRAPDGATGSATMLGSAAEVQAFVDGAVEVRAPDLVARAVTHNVARGAMLQAQRAQVELPQQVLSSSPGESTPASVPVEAAAVDAAPEPDGDVPRPAGTEATPAARPAQAAPRGAASAPAAPLESQVLADAPAAPGSPESATATVRGASATAAAANDAALAAGRPTEAQLGQVAVPDADHMELKVSDGDHSFRLSIAREADGLNVELKAPREIVADLRALEPDVEAALAEDGYDLASFDAHADDSAGDRDADGRASAQGAEAVDDAVDGAATAPPPVAPAGQGHLVNRLA